ncbi:hypothetical protein P691DRAFT_795112 [Macrolepiota fuliginosa MF-IS2]|uniref:DDE Tnp4 domain-containing protein n=1 Tax=Macrolepiota fuliginosa MF-IS2 TaxID=1400762 RepID=A0A9P6BVS7_9AGAR|nr:hypothetical protein P691DRAFT_795112 [Macrolepiota fuliginosa MF-IS2]
MEMSISSMLNKRPDKFQEQIHITPPTFDALVKEIQDDLVFTNNANQGQQSVEEQLAVTLVAFPDTTEKEAAKQWVENHSCHAWCNGWCFVGGTLIPLEFWPAWYVVSLPNLQIINFSYGYTGSTHDSTAWEQTMIAQDYGKYLEDGEWIWADSAYPVCSHFMTSLSLDS